MTNEVKERINFLLKDLVDQTRKYNIATNSGAGFYERRDIRSKIREIETELQQLKGLFKS